MINTSSLDTSLVVRVLSRDDEKKCRKVLELLVSGGSFMFSYETMTGTVTISKEYLSGHKSSISVS